MREDVGQPRIVIEERGGGAGSFLLGVLVGAGAALLLAPRSGRDTQREIRGFVTGRVDAVRGAVDTGVEQARTAVHEGRSAAAQARTDLQRRVQEAKASYRGGQRPEPPRAPALQLATSAPSTRAVQEVVITEVTTEPDAGDLAGGEVR
ncbi:MAG TPA: YtxH domain-containing protein [Longimicrobium sp.]|nr:YtxH domain-containing protein [Longimicrobium sp.]